MIEIYNQNCETFLQHIPAQSVHMVLCDPPYKILQNCKWDNMLNWELIWKELDRILVPDAMSVIFCNQPFTSYLMNTNMKNFTHHWIWNKKNAGNGLLAKKQPMRIHEELLVFKHKKVRYFPIMRTGKMRNKGGGKKFGTFGVTPIFTNYPNDQYYPTTIVEFSKVHSSKRLHLTEKPVELLEYFIQTYSLKGETVLDFTMGVGSTLIAANNLNRNAIGIELDETFYNIAKGRLSK